MRGEEGLHPRRVWFAAGRVRGHGHYLLVEGFWGAHCEHRRRIHASTPDLAIVAGQLQCQAPGRHAGVSAVRIAAANGEATDHRHPFLAEHARLGQRRSLLATEEVTADTKAFGVILTVSRVVASLRLEGIDNAFRGQAVAADPAGGIGKACGQGAQAQANCNQTQGAGSTV
ncbi:hypothetical protein D3C78_871040 [compost metagenome]